MRKQILTWNPKTKMYSTRYATEEEKILFNKLKTLQGELRHVMAEIDSYEGTLHLGLYNKECDIRKEILAISKILGIELNVPGHILW